MHSRFTRLAHFEFFLSGARRRMLDTAYSAAAPQQESSLAGGPAREKNPNYTQARESNSRHNSIKRLHDSKSGFTIVEFMVATLVFSIVLLGVTAAIMHISRTYQRSLNESATQAAARNLVDAVGQAIQFSSSQVVSETNPGWATKSLCIGNRQLLYMPGHRITDTFSPTTTPNAAVIRQSTAECPIVGLSGGLPSGGSPKELLGQNMRLSNLIVSQVSGTQLYTVTARVVYGDDDLLCSETQDPGSCQDSNAMSDTDIVAATDLECKPSTVAASQFCAASEISTTVQRRLQ